MPEAVFEDAYGEALRLVQEGQAEAALRALAPFQDHLVAEREHAAAALRLWRALAGQPALVGEVKRLAQAFPADPEVIMLACDALIREAERLPPDEPPPAQGAALLAVELAQNCLAKLDTAQREQPDTLPFLQVCYGNALRLAHLHDRALSALSSAVNKHPERGAWWFNLGLLHKQRRDFEAGLEANLRARELLGDQKGLLWNVAICATALGHGSIAVDAYNALGITAYTSPTGMPQVDYMPPIQVRVATVGPGHMGPSQLPDAAVGFELLWVSPLSPCHGVVQTPTYRQGSVDYGDVILWDAVAVGQATLDGRAAPRFPLLAVLNRGKEHRFRFIALQREPGAINALEGALEPAGQLFVHRERVEVGPGSSQPEAAAAADDERLVYGKVVLPKDTVLKDFRKSFEQRLKEANVELVMPELLEALGDTAGAGKAHTMWRGLERTVEKTQGKKDD